jgi:peptidoglycan hydrolase CwlO-like protein
MGSRVGKTSFVALAVALVVLTGGVTQAASSQDLSSQIDQAERDQKAAKNALREAKKELSDLLEEYDRTWHEWQNATADVLEIYRSQRALEAQLAAAKFDFNRRVTAAYEAGPGLTIELLLGSQSVSDFTSMQEYAARAFAFSQQQIDELSRQRAAFEGMTGRLEKRQTDLRRSQEHLDLLAVTITAKVETAKAAAKEADLNVSDLERQQEELLSQQSSVAAMLAALDEKGIGTGCSSGHVHDLIVSAFGPLGQDEVDHALEIANRESGCNPNAYNDIYVAPYGNASGVFQILYPGIWQAWTERCGYQGASPFDAEANVEVAACVVADQGWGPWSL